jgi:NADH-quinone oxidoreductase subunit C/D
MIATTPTIAQEVGDRFGAAVVAQDTHDRIPTFWVAKDRVSPMLRFLKEEIDQPYKMLYDLSAIDERMRVHRDGQPASDLRLFIICFLLTGTSTCA